MLMKEQENYFIKKFEDERGASTTTKAKMDFKFESRASRFPYQSIPRTQPFARFRPTKCNPYFGPKTLHPKRGVSRPLSDSFHAVPKPEIWNLCFPLISFVALFRSIVPPCKLFDPLSCSIRVPPSCPTVVELEIDSILSSRSFCRWRCKTVSYKMSQKKFFEGRAFLWKRSHLSSRFMNSFGVDLKAFNASAITRTYGLDGGSIHEVFYVRGKFLQTVQNFQKTA